MSWFPLHCHSTFSLQRGLSKPEQIAKRLAECGYTGCAITDTEVLAGVPSFVSQLKKNGLKGIAGCELNIGDETLCVLAQDTQGWKSLIKVVSDSNNPENWNKKPIVKFESLAGHNFIAYSGCPGSTIANCLFKDAFAAYSATTIDEAKSQLKVDYDKVVLSVIDKHVEVIGKDNFFLEIQSLNEETFPAAFVINKVLRWAANKTGVRKIATVNSHYCRRNDAFDQRILICNLVDATLKEASNKIRDPLLNQFFKTNQFHIPTIDELKAIHPESELETTLEIAARCESPVVTGPALLPRFDCPEKLSPDGYLTKLCREGWKEKIANVVPKEKHKEYGDRVKSEFEVLFEANLSSYFLIVQDFINHAKEKGMKVGVGRGSAAGCMVSYLLGITGLDPIRNDLLFSRFYTSARNVPCHISLEELPFEKFTPSAEGAIIHDMIEQSPKFLELKNNKHFKDELSTLKSRKVASYYFALSQMELNRDNPSNSWVLYALGCVDQLDRSSSAKIQDGRVSLPDIDVDFPITRREEVIDYIRQKYGSENVCQMATFSRMQGRGALKDVFRARESCSFEEMNLITANIPDEAEIADQLQIMLEAGEEPSIIRWALENNKEALSAWCEIDEEGNLSGPYAIEFEQAIRLEGTKRSMGKHASALIISSEPVGNIVPMVNDKSGNLIAGFDMRDIEAAGLVKFDILGLNTLDKISDAESIIRLGRIA